MQHVPRLFWTVQTLTIINIVYQTASVFLLGNQPIGLINGIQSSLCFNVLWSICYRYKQSFSKFVFMLWFIIMLIMNIIPAYVTQESIFYVKTIFNESYYAVSLLYIYALCVFTYCEFKLCLIVYTPVYLVVAYLLSLS